MSASTHVTRRRVLAGAGATAAAAALPSSAGARRARRPSRRKADVIVVGAGLAGLAAATTVASTGRSVLVLEARRRVGGRTLNHALGAAHPGKIVEIGGQWIGPTQDRLFALAKELGVETFKTYNDGQNVYHADGTNRTYASGGPLGPVPPDTTGAAEAFVAIERLNQMAAQVPRDAPWTASNAALWDSQTIETWKLANMETPGGRHLIDVGIEAVFAAEPRDVSLLFALFYIACAGNESTPGDLNRLFNTPGGAQEQRFVGGSQLLSIRMAQRLGRKRVKLGQAVRRIEHVRGGVRVVTDTLTAAGKQVIVTGPPAVTACIDYEPILPARRAQYLQRAPQGSVIKCVAMYDEPFWRKDGLTGQAVSDTGPVKITFDNSPPDGKPGILLGFIEGQEARIWNEKSLAERRQGVLQSFARYFGDRALAPNDYVEMSWSNEQWTRGCYGGFLAPGVLLDYGPAIRQPIGRMHWAGAESASIWNGYMDGAVRSGERAATEALHEI